MRTTKVQTKTPVVELHPAQKAGATVHSGVVVGAAAVATGVTVAGQYIFNFFKGVVKGT